jgi:pimeloyl-ACP methyl ester carboxylesterase
MSKEHSVVVIPGLGDEVSTLKKITAHWRNYGLEPIIHSVGWRDGENEFAPKLKRLVSLIDQLAEEGDTVSLVGTSAGGSAVLNAFIERKDIVRRVVNVCGRLRTGPEHGFRSFQSKTASSPAFAQSVKLAEAREASLSEYDRGK